MPKTEQRAFAAVRTGRHGGQIIVTSTVRRMASEAREAAASYRIGGWPECLRRGWRIRPVLIRVEEEEPTHDR